MDANIGGLIDRRIMVDVRRIVFTDYSDVRCVMAKIIYDFVP